MDDYESLDSFFGGGLNAPNSIPGSSEASSAFSMNNGYAQMDSSFTSQGNFQSANDDLNSFFTPGLNGPGKAMLPYGNENQMMAQDQWDNGEGMQMFEQQFPFPVQPPQMQPPQMQQQMPVDSNAMMAMTWNGDQKLTVSIEKNNHTADPEQQVDAYDEIEKPKRGRPRKRKRKDALSEQEQQRKREAFLERNRRAASKCRQRKKESTENIQARVSNLDKEKRMLTAELMHLRAEYARWLNVVIQHANACPNNGIFQATMDAAAENRMAVSGLRVVDMSVEEVMDWDAFSRHTAVDMDQNRMSESMSPRDTSNLSYTEMGADPSQQRAIAQHLGFSFDRSGLDPIETSRDHNNIEIKLEKERLRKIEADTRTTSLQQSSDASLEDLQLNTSMSMSRSNSIRSNSSSTGTGKSSTKDSGYETNVTTPPSPRQLEFPDSSTMSGRMVTALKRSTEDDSQFARTLRSGTVIAKPHRGS